MWHFFLVFKHLNFIGEHQQNFKIKYDQNNCKVEDDPKISSNWSTTKTSKMEDDQRKFKTEDDKKKWKTVQTRTTIQQKCCGIAPSNLDFSISHQ